MLLGVALGLLQAGRRTPTARAPFPADSHIFSPGELNAVRRSPAPNQKPHGE